MQLFSKLQKKLGFLILFVTHDVSSAAKICQEAAVIQKGRIVESGEIEDLLTHPQHPYTKLLIESNFANREFRQ